MYGKFPAFLADEMASLPSQVTPSSMAAVAAKEIASNGAMSALFFAGCLGIQTQCKPGAKPWNTGSILGDNPFSAIGLQLFSLFEKPEKQPPNCTRC